MVRAMGDKALRFEFRLPGADANPYWIISAILASGIAGINNELEPPDPVEGNAYEADAQPIPMDLNESVQAFSVSDVAMEAFGPQVFRHLLRLCEHERDVGRRAVTDWEISRGFERA